MRPARDRAAALLLAAALVVVSGCSDRSGSSGSPGQAHEPAEPGRAPSTTVAPAGSTKQVAPLPQGIVYDARTDSLAVAVHDPYRLLVLDPTTLRRRFSVQLPGKARHLQVTKAGGTALVGSETANRVFEVDLRTGRARSTTVQRHPHDATGTDDGDVLVGNEFSGSVSVVHDGKVVHTFDDLRQPGGVLASGRTAIAVDVRDYSVTTYDLRDRKRLARIPAGAGPTHGALVGDGRIVVTDTRGGRVLLDSVRPLKQLSSIRLGHQPYGLVGDPTTQMAWVTLIGTNQLVGLDVSGDRPKVVARYPTVRQPDTVAVAPGGRTLWVTGTKNGEVQRITR